MTFGKILTIAQFWQNFDSVVASIPLRTCALSSLEPPCCPAASRCTSVLGAQMEQISAAAAVSGKAASAAAAGGGGGGAAAGAAAANRRAGTSKRGGAAARRPARADYGDDDTLLWKIQQGPIRRPCKNASSQGTN